MQSLGKTLRTPLIKAVATGNDFVIVDLLQFNSTWEAEHGGRHRAKWVRDWCDRQRGIGADGALFLEAHPQCDFAWDFYNSDGSPAEMCGNAARAVALYRFLRSGQREMSFLTRSGVVKARVDSPDSVEVVMAAIAQSEWKQATKNSAEPLNFDFIKAGVPHAVVQVNDLDDHDRLKTLALAIKGEERFKDQGTNVTFVHARSEQAIESVTFERGVEGFTLSCGTGAVAAAHTVLRGQEDRPLEVRVPGGRLQVVFKGGRPHLIGPARLLAEIHWFTGG